MIHNIISGFETWFFQVKNLLLYRIHHLSPQDYCVMTVLCISIGYCLLKGRS